MDRDTALKTLEVLLAYQRMNSKVTFRHSSDSFQFMTDSLLPGGGRENWIYLAQPYSSTPASTSVFLRSFVHFAGCFLYPRYSKFVHFASCFLYPSIPKQASKSSIKDTFPAPPQLFFSFLEQFANFCFIVKQSHHIYFTHLFPTRIFPRQ